MTQLKEIRLKDNAPKVCDTRTLNLVNTTTFRIDTEGVKALELDDATGQIRIVGETKNLRVHIAQCAWTEEEADKPEIEAPKVDVEAARRALEAEQQRRMAEGEKKRGKR